jgi:hypothetical protein
MFILVSFFAFYTLHTLINFLFSLADELLFFSYRKIRVTRPVFITGAPRTGTTFMHRTLAEDKDVFTSFTLGEILFAPSITQKYILHALSWLDERIGLPFRRIMLFIEGKLGGSYGKIHNYSLFRVDEDEILMVSIFSSLYLMFLFPEAEPVTRYARFDEMVPGKERSRVMKYYLRNIRKHLWFARRKRGRMPVYLSKSPVYISRIGTMLKWFPDCRIIYLRRETAEVLPSWISMNATVFRIFHSPSTDFPLKEETRDLLREWIQKADKALSEMDQRSVFEADYGKFISEPDKMIFDIYTHLGFEMTANYRAILEGIGIKQKNYRSEHKYSLPEIGIST